MEPTIYKPRLKFKPRLTFFKFGRSLKTQIEKKIWKRILKPKHNEVLTKLVRYKVLC